MKDYTRLDHIRNDDIIHELNVRVQHIARKCKKDGKSTLGVCLWKGFPKKPSVTSLQDEEVLADRKPDREVWTSTSPNTGKIEEESR